MININLIAERRARKQREDTVLRISWMGVALVLLGMVALNVTWWNELRITESARNQMEAKAAESEEALKQFLALKAEVQEKDKIVMLLRQVRVSESAWMTILADVSHLIPDDVVLTGLTTQAGDKGVAVRLTGQARDERMVAQFMQDIPDLTRWARTPNLNRLKFDDQQGYGRIAGFELVVPVIGLYGGDL